MSDEVYAAFLRQQHDQALAFGEASDIVDLTPLDPYPARHWLAVFKCRGLAETEAGEVVETSGFGTHFWLDDDYLRSADPGRNLLFMGPKNTFHPNVRSPFICIGDIAPGTPLCELVARTYEVLSYQRFTMDESRSLNPRACAYARAHRQRFPLDARPIKRGRRDFEIEVVG